MNLLCPLLLGMQLWQAVQLYFGALSPRALGVEPSVNVYSGALTSLANATDMTAIGVRVVQKIRHRESLHIALVMI